MLEKLFMIMVQQVPKHRNISHISLIFRMQAQFYERKHLIVSFRLVVVRFGRSQMLLTNQITDFYVSHRSRMK